MPTVIDSLIITLDLDPSNFTKGQKEAANAFLKTRQEALKGAKEIEESAKKAADSIHRIATEALAMFAVFTGSRGLKDFISDLISANAQLGRFAGQINESPQVLAAWGNAAERVGGSADATASSFEKIASALNDLHTYGKTLPIAYYRLMADSNLRIDTEHGPARFLRDVAIAVHKLAETDPAKAAFYAKGMGIDQGTVSLMIQYGGAIDQYVSGIQKLSPSPAQIKASQDLLEAWRGLQQTAISLGNQVLPTLDKVLTPVLRGMAAWVDQNRDLINLKVGEVMIAVRDALNGIKWSEVTNGFASFATAADNVATAINSIAGSVRWLYQFNEDSKSWPIMRWLNGTQAPAAAPGTDTNPFGQSGNGGAPPLTPDQIQGLGGILQHRAAGGPVNAGQTVIVGERGQERFTPSVSGVITPNSALGGGDTTIEGRPVNKANPMPVSIEGLGNSTSENWIQTLGKGIGSLFSGPGGATGSGHSFAGASGDPGAAARATAPLGRSALKGSSAELVAYIRASAIAHGIDPDVALRVARGEGGLSNPYRHGEGPAPRSQLRSLGAKENSYGPFQLYISGTGAGLGDRALKAGVDPRVDWKAGVDFALAEVRRVGWDQWYGARAAGIRGKAGVGALPIGLAAGARVAAGVNNANDNSRHSTTSVHVDKVEVHTQATDPQGVANALTSSLSRTTKASTANYGLK